MSWPNQFSSDSSRSPLYAHPLQGHNRHVLTLFTGIASSRRPPAVSPPHSRPTSTATRQSDGSRQNRFRTTAMTGETMTKTTSTACPVLHRNQPACDNPDKPQVLLVAPETLRVLKLPDSRRDASLPTTRATSAAHFRQANTDHRRVLTVLLERRSPLEV